MTMDLGKFGFQQSEKEKELYEALSGLKQKLHDDYEKYRKKYEYYLIHRETVNERTFNNIKGRMHASRDAWKQLSQTLEKHKPKE